MNDSTEDLSKTYTNNDFGFSFKYPSNWKLVTDLEDAGRGAPEGNIYVQSTNGIKVHFDPDFGGKGGDCADDQANDEHTTRTCPTQTILSLDQFSKAPNGDKIYFYTEKYTEATRDGGATHYNVFIGCGEHAPSSKGSESGAIFETFDKVSCIKQGAVSPHVEYPDGTDMRQASFLNSEMVKQATPILKSFVALP